MIKFLKSARVTAALVLALTFISLLPINTAAAANTGKYVSEVYVAYGKNADDAKKTLEDKGYAPVEGNLNDGGKTYVMMGYKTTGDIRESITDLAVMNMSGGYSVEDYKTFLKSQKIRIAEFLNEFMSVIKEYRSNLKAGKTKAAVVRDLLNNYTDDDTGMKMGDLLNSETLQDKLGIQESIEAKNPENLPNLIQRQAKTAAVFTLIPWTISRSRNKWSSAIIPPTEKRIISACKTERFLPQSCIAAACMTAPISGSARPRTARRPSQKISVCIR